MSRKARQLNRDVAETPLWSDNKVVNVASSMVTTPPIRSGPCSGMRVRQCAVLGPRVPRGRGRRAPKRWRRRAWPIGYWQEGVRFEAKVGDRVYLEDRIAGGTVNRGFRCDVWGRHGDVAAKNFAGIL